MANPVLKRAAVPVFNLTHIYCVRPKSYFQAERSVACRRIPSRNFMQCINTQYSKQGSCKQSLGLAHRTINQLIGGRFHRFFHNNALENDPSDMEKWIIQEEERLIEGLFEAARDAATTKCQGNVKEVETEKCPEDLQQIHQHIRDAKEKLNSLHSDLSQISQRLEVITATPAPTNLLR